MRDRAALVGAKLEIHSKPDGGTSIAIILPLNNERTLSL